MHTEHKHKHHHHEHECSCGHKHHDHGYEHHHEHVCSCGHEHHDHGHKHHHAHHHKKTYLLENLGCANCAAKMEARIRQLPDVEDAALTFATKQLDIYTAKKELDLLSEIQKICSSIEDEVVVTERKKQARHTHEKDVSKEINTDRMVIRCGLILFIGGIITERFGLGLIPVILFIIAYIILGLDIVKTAFRNLTKGHIFDENFLMSVSTIAAFCIGDFPEAVGIMLFYRIGEYFEERAVEKSRNQIMNAIDMRPEVVQLVQEDTDGNLHAATIPAEDALIGDIIMIRPGDRIPLDGVVIDGESRIDTSPVTGEPVPVKAYPGVALLSGCINTSGLLKLKVEKTLDESMVTKILDSVEHAAATKPTIDRFITKFARIYTPIVVALALATAVIPSLLTGDWKHWIYTAITFLVISCPCALVLSVPLAFFSGIGAGSKKGILYKGGASLEAISKIKAIAMDKTGTLTKGDFSIQNIVSCEGFSSDELLTMAAGCESSSTHPIAQSIMAEANSRKLSWESPETLEEISGKGIRAAWGSDTILCGSKKLMISQGVTLPEQLDTIYGTEVLLAKNGSYIGHLIIADTMKPDTESAIRDLKRYGLKTIMLTGDSEASANAIAEKVGIDNVHSRLLPDEKLHVLAKLRQTYGAVMYIGDGINDAPVLANADVSAAMGSGADAAIEVADIVFMNSGMSSVPEAIRIAAVTRNIAWQNVVFALGIKLLVMILGLMGYASMWLAVFADTGVAMLCVLNSIRILYRANK